MDILTTTREDLADIRRAEFLLGRSAERASIRQLALDEATKLEERFAINSLGPLYDPLVETLYASGLLEAGDRAEATLDIRKRLATCLRDFAALLEDR